MFLPPPPAGDEAKPAKRQQPDVHGYVLECLERGSTAGQIRKQLIARGHSAEEASEIVDTVMLWRKKQQTQRGVGYGEPDAIRSAGTRNMVIGGAICALGLIVTIGSCAAASQAGGGTYIVASGAIVWGFIQFLRGAAQASSGRQQ